MIQQRPINLNPRAEYFEVVKITYPKRGKQGDKWRIEPMRFIPHDGRAK